MTAVASLESSHGCSFWLCLDTSEFTECFFCQKNGLRATMNDPTHDDDPRGDVMAMDKRVLYGDNVEVSLEDLCVDRNKENERNDKERRKEDYQERIKKAREEQNKRYLQQQQEEQVRKVAEAKEAKRLASQKNAEEQKVEMEREEKARRMAEAAEAESRLTDTLKSDEATRQVRQAEEAMEDMEKTEKDEFITSKTAVETEESLDKTREDKQQEELRGAKETIEIDRLKQQQAAEAAEQLRIEKQEEEKIRKANEAKEARRRARQKAVEAEERMKKARELQRKLYEKQHQEEIRKKAEEAKEARRLAIQQKMEQQKKEAEEQKARLFAQHQAEIQRVGSQMEFTKQGRDAWLSQQAAAAEQQRQEWQKDWHAKQQKQSYYYPLHQQTPQSPQPIQPNGNWYPATSTAHQNQTPSYHAPGAAPVNHQKWQQSPSTSQQTPVAPHAVPHQQWQAYTPNTHPQGFTGMPKAQQSPPVSPPSTGKAIPLHQPGSTPQSSPTKPLPCTTNGDVQQEVFTKIKRDIMIAWALQPPAYQILRPIEVLLTTMHTVFPSDHKYFSTWTPITDVSQENQLKKAVRKIRFLLHSDKLPKDLTEEQLYVCKLLWDVTNDAWEQHIKSEEELDWIKKL